MSNPTRPVTRPSVLVVDADRRVRGSLSALLELEQDVTVVGVAADAATAIELAALHSPDVVVLDPRLPDVDAGVALLSFLRHRLPTARLVVCACADLEGSTALAAADAVLSKGVDPGAFVAAVLGRDWAAVKPAPLPAPDDVAVPPAGSTARVPAGGRSAPVPAAGDATTPADERRAPMPAPAEETVPSGDPSAAAVPFARLAAGNAGKVG